MPLTVSVIIPTYNQPHLLPQALDSLHRQSYPQECFEVIVVDDGSPIGVENWMGIQIGLRCVVLRHDRNRGRAAACNTGIKRAKGEVILFFDDDETAIPDLLGIHTAYHKRREDLVVIGNMYPHPCEPRDRLARYLSTKGVHRFGRGEVVPFQYFVGGNASVRKANLLKAGLFDERFTAYGGEDTELAYRLHKIGLKFIYAPEALTYHYHTRTLDHMCKLILTSGETSLPIILKKHPELTRLFRAHLATAVNPFKDPLTLSIKKVLFRIAMNPLCYWIVKRTASAFLHLYVPHKVFDYIWAYNFYDGFRQSAYFPAFCQQ